MYAIRSYYAKGGWLLDGNKIYITNGNIADVIVVFAVTDPDKGTRGGMTGFILEKTYEGFRAGKPEKKMGIRGSHTTDLYFDNVFIPKRNNFV